MVKYTRVALISKDSGQGEVYRGLDPDGHEVAIKYVKLPVAIAEVGAELKRFEREIACQRQLDHPGIAKIVASNLKHDPPFYVMALADGSLRDLLLFNPGGMDEDDALPIMFKVLDAASFAHRAGVLHRDLKPENILMYGDEPVIADFGLGRRLQSGSTTITIANVGLGTIQYSAPEQLRDGHSGDERADIYSLGCILYEMLTGNSPFPRIDLQAVPPRFRHIVFMATRDKPEDRYASVVSMVSDLKISVNGYETLRTPLDRATSILDAIEAGEGGKKDVKALSRLLIEHSDDPELYETFVTRATAELMNRLVAVSMDSFEEIVSALDVYASGRFDWDFSDVVGSALVAVYWATEDLTIRTTVLRRMMLLAVAHHRFRVRDDAAELVVAAIAEQTYVQIVASFLRDNPAVRDFMAIRLKEHSLPAPIVTALATAA